MDELLSHRSQMFIEAGKRGIPLDVALEITHHCNFRCQHCYIPDFSVPNSVPTERYLSLLDELVAMGTLYLTLTGGEVFLRRDWYVIAQRARQLGFEVVIFTNGATVTEQVADQVRDLYCKVEVSFYSAVPTVFEEITQRRGSFDATVRGVERLRARDVEVLLKVPLTRFNHDQYPGVFDYAVRLGAECRADSKIVHRKDGNLVTIGTRARERDLHDYYRGPYSPCVAPGEASDDPLDDAPLCAAGNRYANITAAGDVLACNILPGSAGNILEKSFREIWETSPWLLMIRGIRRRHLKTCDTCPKGSYCGRCHAQALVEDGDIFGPSKWACDHAASLEEAFAAVPEQTR
jgi:radical SAM protein with 4Fe4S-binding SPASM domain